MTDFEREEFWKSLNRLYDETLALRESIGGLEKAVRKLADGATKLLAVAEAHESRLDKIEVVQQWLVDRERQREKRDRKE